MVVYTTKEKLEGKTGYKKTEKCFNWFFPISKNSKPLTCLNSLKINFDKHFSVSLISRLLISNKPLKLQLGDDCNCLNGLLPN